MRRLHAFLISQSSNDDPVRDNLYGGGGPDSIWGGEGNDYLWGDAGNDELHGGQDTDKYDGGAGLSDSCDMGISDVSINCEIIE